MRLWFLNAGIILCPPGLRNCCRCCLNQPSIICMRCVSSGYFSAILGPGVIISSWQMSYMMMFTPLHILKVVWVHMNEYACLHLPRLIAKAT